MSIKLPVEGWEFLNKSTDRSGGYFEVNPEFCGLPFAGPVAQGCPAGVPGGQTGPPVGLFVEEGPSEGASPGAQARSGARPQGSAAIALTDGKSADKSSNASAAASGRILMWKS